VSRVELHTQPIDLRTDWSQRLASIGTRLAVIAAFVTISVTARADQQQAALIERGQATDRFSKAVDPLRSNQRHLAAAQLHDQVDEIAQRPTQPIQTPHHQGAPPPAARTPAPPSAQGAGRRHR